MRHGGRVQRRIRQDAPGAGAEGRGDNPKQPVFLPANTSRTGGTSKLFPLFPTNSKSFQPQTPPRAFHGGMSCPDGPVLRPLRRRPCEGGPVLRSFSEGGSPGEGGPVLRRPGEGGCGQFRLSLHLPALCLLRSLASLCGSQEPGFARFAHSRGNSTQAPFHEPFTFQTEPFPIKEIGRASCRE